MTAQAPSPTPARLAHLDSINPLTSDLEPGVRMLAGRPYTYDMDARNDWRAVAAKMDAPDDLSGLGDDELTALSFKALRLIAISGGVDGELSRRVAVEMGRRGYDSAGRLIDVVGGRIASRNHQWAA